MPMQPIERSVVYTAAKPSDTEEIIRLLATIFSASEPPAVAMGLTFRDLEQFLQLLAPGVMTQDLTIVARTENAVLAGALLIDDFGAPPVVDPSLISPKFFPIFSMLEILDEQFRAGKTIRAGEFLHLFMLAVDGKFARRGIAQGLVAASLDNGLRKGYRGALTEATGRVSQQVFRKQGFVERFSVAYQDFRYEDRLVFASIREHEKAILMERLLG